MDTIRLIENKIENILKHLKPLLPLTNSHMVDFIIKNIWESYAPTEIKNEIKNSNPEDVLKHLLDISHDTKNFPAVTQFIETCQNIIQSENASISITDLRNTFLKNYQLADFHLKQFMSVKKSHEVKIMATIVSALINITNITYVADIGDGKGYLSSILALNYQHKVLGIDASETNTKNANNRAEKLSRIWNNIANKTDQMKITKKEITNTYYKQITSYVTKSTDVQELIKESFDVKECKDIAIVGLHTCGNLAPISLEKFTESRDIKLICNVGCCYHLLDEQFPTKQDVLYRNKFIQQYENYHGFPMSQYLKRQKFRLGRNSRMLAAQSFERIMSKSKLPSDSLFYRSLLQKLLQDKYGDKILQGQAGRSGSKCQTFQEYVRKVAPNFGSEVMFSDQEIYDVYDRYSCVKDVLNIYQLMRVNLAPVIELLILTDRLLYLYEKGYESSFLVKMFDPVISPRCYAIIAKK